MAIDPRTAVIIGVAQQTYRAEELPGPEPLDAWATACRAAAEDGGLTAQDLQSCDFLSLALPMSWNYDDPLARLADELSALPRRTYLSAPSGTAGHSMLFLAAKAIREEGAELAIICGGESLATVRHYRKAGEAPPWRYHAPPGSEIDYDKRRLPAEVAAGLTEGIGAVYNFAMRDVARRAHLGISPQDYRQQLGELAAGMTRVASRNPDAWFPVARDPEFLIKPRPDNRVIAYPYTKHLTSIIDVDITAAVIVVSEEFANKAGIPKEKRVYPWQGCYAQDPVFTATRPRLWESSAMKAASKALMDSTGLTMDDVRYVDLYSCFPAAVNFSRDALGISDRGGESITLTGGLPYGGGPGSSYVVTSLGKMVKALRSDPGALGLVSGLGKQMTTHAYGIYSSEPPPPHIKKIDEQAVQAKVDAEPLVEVIDNYEGPAKVLTYTVIHDRSGEPSHGAAICEVDDRTRAYARILDPELLIEAETSELVGRSFDIRADNNSDSLGSLRYA